MSGYLSDHSITAESLFLNFEKYSYAQIQDIFKKQPKYLTYQAPWGTTFLHLAAMRDRDNDGPALLKFLLDQSTVHLNTANHMGITPLAAAKFLKCKQQYWLLQKAGASPDFEYHAPKNSLSVTLFSQTHEPKFEPKLAPIPEGSEETEDSPSSITSPLPQALAL